MQNILSLRGMHWVATRLGGEKLRALSFDEKYRNGEWDFHQETPELVHLVENYGAQGQVLALGCGTASIAGALNPDSYAGFLGVDLSPEAIAIARRQASDKIRFEIGDMTKFEPAHQCDVVLFAESLYYVSYFERKKLLAKCVRSLTPGGRIIVAIAQPARYGSIFRMIRRNFNVEIDRNLEGTTRRVMVFR